MPKAHSSVNEHFKSELGYSAGPNPFVTAAQKLVSEPLSEGEPVKDLYQSVSQPICNSCSKTCVRTSVRG